MSNPEHPPGCVFLALPCPVTSFKGKVQPQVKKDFNPLDSEVLGRSAAAAAAKSLQSCLTLCDPIDGSPPGSPVPGILQARTLEWVTISFSNL